MSSWQSYDAMLFDLDGVITRTATLHAAAWKRLFDEFLAGRAEREHTTFAPFDAEADYRTYVDGRPRYDGVATFLAARGIDLERGHPGDSPQALTICGLGNRKNTYFFEELAARGVEVYPDTERLLGILSEAGKRLAVVSASENCDAMLARAGLLDRFEVRVTGTETARWRLAGKPAPDTYLKAAEMLGVPPQRAVVFEDAISGVQAGRAGGFGLVVGVDRHGTPEPLASGGADVVLSDVTELLRLDGSSLTSGPPQHAQGAAGEPGSFDGVRFEGILVCLPAHAGAAQADVEAHRRELDDQVARLAGLGVAVAVVAGEQGRDSRLEQMASGLAGGGVGSGLMLVVGWIDGLALPVVAARAHVVSVLRDPPADGDAQWVGGGAPTCVAVLRRQADRREAGLVPSIDLDPAWTVTVTGDDPAQRRAHQSLLTVADTRFGTRGVREEDALGTLPRVLAAGIFDEEAVPPTLLEGPTWTGLHLLRRLDTTADQRTLDLRGGVLVREQPAEPVPLRTIRFASLARPGSFALRAEGAVEWLLAGPALVPPATDGTFSRRQHGDSSIGESRTRAGGAIAAATAQTERSAGGRRVVDRFVSLAADPDGASRVEDATAALGRAQAMGFDALLAEHRAAWARRWDDALISIDGDPDLDIGVRFSLFHLMGCVPTDGEAAVGARGVAGPAYRGHVFWDADVFTLPFFAATHPSAARAMLEYRIRRLDVARRAAAERGLRGVRFPWESARTGVDVTPSEDLTPIGTVIPIYTGEHEEHIVADVAWAAWQYAAWTGDESLLQGPGRPLLLDTARYWASRVRLDAAGAGHIDDVIGPDEYHERVDDDVFTNVMARWNLRRAAELAERVGDVDPGEIGQWREVADALVDNYDRATGRYEQFVGYDALQPLVISDLAETPVAADLIFGRDRISASQVVKQPDVLMAHHLVPEEMAPGSLAPNVEFYEPRCAHGSSLSPAIHAGLFARLGRPDDGLRLLRMACRLDLDNLNGTTSGGLHVATFGGVWQALVFGFAGIRPGADALVVDPRIPNAWNELRLRLRYRGRRVEVCASPDSLRIGSDGPVRVIVPPHGAALVGAGADRRWSWRSSGWEVT